MVNFPPVRTMAFSLYYLETRVKMPSILPSQHAQAAQLADLKFSRRLLLRSNIGRGTIGETIPIQGQASQVPGPASGSRPVAGVKPHDEQLRVGISFLFPPHYLVEKGSSRVRDAALDPEGLLLPSPIF